MTSLLLVPLDDTVVFPTMDVTLPVDAGDEERVLLVPRHDGEFAKVGTIAEVTDTVRLPGGGRAVSLSGVAPRRRRRRPHRSAPAACASRSTSTPTTCPSTGAPATAEREYRAVVEEILELRGADERVAAFLRSIAEPGALADTVGYAPDLSFEQKVQVAGDARRHRAPRARGRVPARAADRAAGAQAHPRRRRVRRPEAAARVLPAQADGVDPRELGEDYGSVAEEYRTKIAEAGMPDEVREQAERSSTASSAWASSPARRR